MATEAPATSPRGHNQVLNLPGYPSSPSARPLPPHGIPERGKRALFNKTLALVPKSVKVTVNAGPLEVGDLTFPSYRSQDHRVSPTTLSWKFFYFFSVFPNWNGQYPDLILGFRGVLKKPKNRGSEIRGAVHRGPRMKAWPSVMSKALVTEEALGIGQTERMRNQRI